MDLTCVQGALIEHSSFAAGKDAIGVKSGIGEAGLKYGRPTRDVLLRQLRITRVHGISIGDEVAAGVFNVTFESIQLNGTRCGPRIKSIPGAGGYIEDWSDCQILGCATSADGKSAAEVKIGFHNAVRARHSHRAAPRPRRP